MLTLREKCNLTSVGVKAPAGMSRSGNEAMSKYHKRIVIFALTETFISS